MLQIVVCSTAARASGLPLRARMFTTRKSPTEAPTLDVLVSQSSDAPQPALLILRAAAGGVASWRRRRLGKIHVPEAYVIVTTAAEWSFRWGSVRTLC